MNSYKIKTKIRRFINKVFKFDRPSSYPYITGDSFRSLCHHYFDEISTITPNSVVNGDRVFVRNNLLHDFFKEIHPFIKEKYVLISHNDDDTIDEKFLSYINDEKIIHWFGVNMNIKHPKVTPLPIGLDNYFYKSNTNINLICSTAKADKTPKIIYGFNHPSILKNRASALIALGGTDAAEKINKTISTEEYYSKVSSYQMIASPEGMGIDCFRTWEAMLLGVIPIVQRSSVTEYYETLNLPIYIINSWEDIKVLNPEKISSIYNTNIQNFNNPALFMDYWVSKIINTPIS
jgi:hypothetical protein